MDEPIEVELTDQDYDQAFGRLYRENMVLRKALQAALEIARRRAGEAEEEGA